ncbi:AraC family transcriptional regulator [Ferrimonas sediminicola]|uniref:AraC family transcriptional regulator n=1 Tax=Ferrimonas sediminicola TaxID=2569538 RepID=A0A4U1BCV4_9GAMM|nr:AraC family transcriptional regulator [Ferrimonas sediminicola]TKB48843.1 AraC family transcriptional regulator [Ferrimonas sediminicola]
MRTQATLLAAWIRPLLYYLQSQGHDPDRLLKRAGICAEPLGLPGARLPVAQVRHLWGEASELTGNPYMGLMLSRWGDQLRGDTLLTAMITSRDMEEACRRMCRISHLVCDAVDLSVEQDERDLRLVYELTEGERAGFSDAGLNLALLPVLTMMEQGVMARSGIRRLELNRAYPGEASATYLASILPCNILYGCARDSLVLDRLATKQQNPFWNPALAQACESLALDELAQLGKQSIVNRVTGLIIKHLSGGEPHQQQVAHELAITPRHLQRKLKQQGYSFSRLLEQVRRELACHHLSRPDTSLAEIARQLGFQDQSNFCKAFKRWQGETPSQYRRRHTLLH